MTKKELRRIYLQKRKTLTESERDLLSRKISDHFFAKVPLHSVKTISIFLPILKNNEPNTWIVIENLRTQFDHIRIAVPRLENGSGEMIHLLLEPSTSLVESDWGIPEPDHDVIIPESEIDLVVVPLITFDHSGNRVGYGKGFYDKFLSRCRPDTLRVGFSFFDGVENIEDTNSFDQRLHYCITPNGVITF